MRSWIVAFFLILAPGSWVLAQEEATPPPETKPTAAILAEELTTDSKLFNHTITEFSNTENDTLQQQFIQKNLASNKEFEGTHIEVFDHFLKNDAYKSTPVERAKKLMGWIDDFAKSELIDAKTASFDKAYLQLRLAILGKNDPKAKETHYLPLTTAIKTLMEKEPEYEWGFMLAGLGVQFFQVVGHEGAFEKDKEYYFNQASVLGKADAQVHFILGNLYLDYYDRKDVSNFLRLVATEFEKTLLIESTSANKELWAAITGSYVQIHEEYQKVDEPEPFWFEELVYKRIIKLDPSNASAHNNLSYLYSQTGVNLKEALKEAQISNQLVPDNAFLLDTMGWAQYKNKDMAGALETLKKAEILDPNVADIHFHLATVYFDLNDLELASKHFKETIRLEPDNAFALNNLAYLFSQHDVNLDEALQLVDKALEKFPDNAAFIDTKGWILYKKADYAEAEVQLKKAIELMSDSSELYLHLGHVYLNLDRFDDATAQFDKALELEPENTQLARDLAHTLAQWGLRFGLERYKKLSGGNTERDNLKVFYSLLSQAYMSQGDVSKAKHALEEFEKLPQQSTGPTVETTGEAAARATFDPALGAIGLAVFLPRDLDAVVSVEKEGLSRIVGMAVKHMKNLPAGALAAEGNIQSIIERVAVGFPLQASEAATCGFLLIELTPMAQAALSRVENLGNLAQSMVTGQLPFPVEIRSRQQSGALLYEITANGQRFYLTYQNGMVAVSCDEKHVETFLAGGPVDEESFLSQVAVQEFISRRGEITPISLFADLSRVSLEMEGQPRYFEPFESVAALAAEWNFGEKDSLEEEMMAFPSDDSKLEELKTALTESAKLIDQEARRLFPQGTSLEYQFQTEDGLVTGSMSLKGLENLVGSLIRRFSGSTEPAPAGP